jgi:hypothetical protein
MPFGILGGFYHRTRAATNRSVTAQGVKARSQVSLRTTVELYPPNMST